MAASLSSYFFLDFQTNNLNWTNNLQATNLIPLLTLWNIKRALFGLGTFGTFGDFLKLKPAGDLDPGGCTRVAGIVAGFLWCLKESPRTTAGGWIPSFRPPEPICGFAIPLNDWLRVTIMADLGRPLLTSCILWLNINSRFPLCCGMSFLVMDGRSETQNNRI